MKITNKHNLPEPFPSLVKEDRDIIDNRFSVTELLQPTRQVVLKRKYYNSLTQDVSDLISALFGSAFHELMEKNTPEGSLTERKYELKISDYTLVGKIDRLDGDTIIDYKTCKVSKITKQNFNEDRLQGLMYAYLRFMVDGMKTKKLIFYNLMKDWSKISYQSNYPTSPIYVWEYSVSDSDYDYIEKYIKDKLIDILNGFENIPLCSEEDKWYTGTKYAVYKNAADKKATKVFDSEQEARDYITSHCNGIGEIKVRFGENLKCQHYCLCKEVCNGEH